MSKLADLQASAIKSLRRYIRSGEVRDTEDLKQVARDFVAAREHFYTRDGDPDWLGRTHAYRHWVRETMSLANVPPEDVASLQASIRYHTGNILRDHLDDRQIEALGLKKSSPRERSIEKRERLSETLGLFSGGRELSDAEEIRAALGLIESSLRRIDEDAVGNDSTTASLLAEIMRRVEALRPNNSKVTK